MIGSIIRLGILLVVCRADIHSKDFILPQPESEIIAIDSSNLGSLAVATKDNVYIYSQPAAYSSTQGTLLGKIHLPTPVAKEQGFLEFKLLRKQQLFYCDHSTCRFCTSSNGNSSCSEYVIKIEKEIPQEITSLAVTRAEEKIYVRVVGKIGKERPERAAIMAFDLQDTGKNDELQYALDAPFISEQVTAAGFSRQSHAFFVGSATQPNEPLITARLGTDNISFVKISRVCTGDKTKGLESRIDLALSCPGVNYESAFVVSAHYIAQLDQLLVLFGEHKNETHHVCKYDMKEVNNHIDQIWNTCQDVSFVDVSRDCEGNFGGLKEHCYTVTHGADGYATTSCRKFGREEEKLPNCELHRTDSTGYHYGWLESYRPFNGTTVARLNIPKSYPWQLLPGSKFDTEPNAIFLATSTGKTGNILRIRLDKNMPVTGYSPVVWTATSNPADRPIAGSSLGEVLYVAEKSKVSSAYLSCADLYKTCDSLMLGGWQDPLSCLWCPDEDKNEVIAASEVKFCQKPLQTICPPVAEHANRDQNHSEWQVFGSNLERLEDGIVYVCDRPCTVNKAISTNTKLHCFLADGSEQPSNCEVRVEGSLENHKQFSIRVPKNTNSVGTDPISEASTNGSKGSKVWKAIVAVLVVVAILLAIGFIVWFVRKRMMGHPDKQHDDNGSRIGLSPQTFLLAEAADRRRSNSYVSPEAIRMESINIYEQLFNEIDERIKIPVDRIRLESPIGKGHFGVVNRASYIAQDGNQMKVACKMIKDNLAGVKEFMDEGLTMSNFNHPRLLKLVGIAFTDEKCPIIVTEYMINGDLVTYLRNKDNSPTLRVLLTFAIQIAEGMEYLHACNFIHRDLAARNCMLDNMLQIKIADFGLCRECNADNMYEPSIKNRDLPLRWMSLEALQSEKFTFKGDVWAYGVVLWELMTRGMIPYGSLKGIGVLDFLRRGDRLGIPPYCPLQLYEHIMLPCWHEDPDERPSFTELVEWVEELVASMERTQNPQLYTHYERVSTTTPTTSGSNGFSNGNALH